MSAKVIVLVYLCVVFYFSASISLTVFNKWFFSEKSSNPTNSTSLPSSGVSTGDRFSHHQFHFPLTVTCVHQFIVFLLVLATERNVLAQFVGSVERSRGVMMIVAPIGVASGLDWGMSNTSLRWIPLTMYEMVKCSSPMFVLALGWWMGVQQLSLKLVMLLAVLTAGVFLSISGGDVSAFGKADFPFQGFICVLCATLLSGIRVTLAQKALHGDVNDNNSSAINTATFMYYATPFSSAVLLVPAYIFEGPLVARYIGTHSPKENMWVAFLVLCSSVIAFFLSLSEYVLTKNTSALTLCVSGVAKQSIITAIAMIVFHEKLGTMNVVGVVISIVGIACYNVLKYQSMMRQSNTRYGVVPTHPDDEMVEVGVRRPPDATPQSTDATEDVLFVRKSERYGY